MGEIRPKRCEGRELTKDQLAGTLPAQAERTVQVLPYNKQPSLQLSLDVPMLENYGTSIASHVSDGDKVKGLFQEPKVNCPPNCTKQCFLELLRCQSH